MALLKRLERNETLGPVVKEVNAWMQRHDKALTDRHWFIYVNMERLDKPEGFLSKSIRKPVVLTCCVVAEVAIATFEVVKHFYELLAVVCDRWEFEPFLIKAYDIINKTVDRVDILAYTALKITFHYTGDASLRPILLRQTQLRDIEAFISGKKAVITGDEGSYSFEDVEVVNVVTKEEMEEATQRASHIRDDKPLKASSFVRGGCRHIELSTQGLSNLGALKDLDVLEGENLIKKRRSITEGHPYTQRLQYLLELSDKPVHLTVDPLSLWFVLELRENMEGFADKLAILEIREGEGLGRATSDAILVYLQKKLEEKHSSFHHVFLMQKEQSPDPSEITNIKKLRRKVFYCDTYGTIYRSEVYRLEKLMVEAHTHAHLQPAPFLATTTERANMGISSLSVARYGGWALKEALAEEDVIPWMGERAVPCSIFTWNSKINLSYVTEKGFFGFYFETVSDFENFCQAFTRLKDENGDFALPCLFFNAPTSETAKVMSKRLKEHSQDLGVEKVYFHVLNIEDPVTLDLQVLNSLGIYTFKFSKKDSRIKPLSDLPLSDLQEAKQAYQTLDQPLEVSFFDEGLITEKAIDELVSAGDNLTTDEAIEIAAMSHSKFAGEGWNESLRKLFEHPKARKKTEVKPIAKLLADLIEKYDQGKKDGCATLLTFEMLMKIFEGNKTFKAQVNALLSDMEETGESLEDKIGYVVGSPQALETHVSHKIRENQDQIDAQTDAINQAINDAIALAKLDQQGDDYNAKRWKNNRDTKVIVADLQQNINKAKAAAKLSREQINLAKLRPFYDEMSRLQRVHQKLKVLLRHVRRAGARAQKKIQAFSDSALRVYSRFELPLIFAPEAVITKEAVKAINSSKPKAVYLFVNGNNLVHNLNQLQHIDVKGLAIYLMPSKDVGSFKIARKLLKEYEQIQKATPAAKLTLPPIVEYAKMSIDKAKAAIDTLKQKGVLICQWLPRFKQSLPVLQETNEEEDLTTGTNTDDDDESVNDEASSKTDKSQAEDLGSDGDSGQDAKMRDEQIYFSSTSFTVKPTKDDWCYEPYRLLKQLGIARSVVNSGGGQAK